MLDLLNEAENSLKESIDFYLHTLVFTMPFVVFL